MDSCPAVPIDISTVLPISVRRPNWRAMAKVRRQGSMPAYPRPVLKTSTAPARASRRAVASSAVCSEIGTSISAFTASKSAMSMPHRDRVLPGVARQLLQHRTPLTGVGPEQQQLQGGLQNAPSFVLYMPEKGGITIHHVQVS